MCMTIEDWPASQLFLPAARFDGLNYGNLVDEAASTQQRSIYMLCYFHSSTHPLPGGRHIPVTPCWTTEKVHQQIYLIKDTERKVRPMPLLGSSRLCRAKNR